MRPEEVRGLLPKHKSDVEAASAIIKAGFPNVAPVLPELLEWIQDMNWPVAKVIAPFLAKVGSPLLPEISRVLDSDDHIWKYWYSVKSFHSRRSWLARCSPISRESPKRPRRPSPPKNYSS